MKIFAWMHRKLQTNVDYSVISREKERFSEVWKKSPSPLTCEKDTEALLRARDHVRLVDALGGWHDGILAIGTFGLDRIHPLDEEYSMEEEEDEDEDDDDEEEEEEERQVQISSLAVAAFKREVDWDVEREMLKSQPLMSVEMDDPSRPFLKGGDWEEEEEKKKKGERTTLADLFNADAAAFGVGEKYCKGTEMSGHTGKKTGSSSTKQARSLAKKLLPWKGDDSRPTTKLHRLMRRMLKRKIHPELERKIHGAIGADDAPQIKPTLDDPAGLKNNLGVKAQGNELVSLLQGIVFEL